MSNIHIGRRHVLAYQLWHMTDHQIEKHHLELFSGPLSFSMSGNVRKQLYGQILTLRGHDLRNNLLDIVIRENKKRNL